MNSTGRPKASISPWRTLFPNPCRMHRILRLRPFVASSYEGILDKNGHAIDPQNKNVVNRLGMEIYGRESLLHWPTNGGNWAEGVKTDLRALQLYYRALAAKTKEFPVAPQAQSPAADVLLALSKYDAAIEELRQAAALPDSRFPLNYDCDPPAGILLPHLAALKKCSQVLQLRAIAGIAERPKRQGTGRCETDVAPDGICAQQTVLDFAFGAD